MEEEYAEFEKNFKLRFVRQLSFAFVGQGYGLAVNDPDRNRLVFAARHSIYKYSFWLKNCNRDGKAIAFPYSSMVNNLADKLKFVRRCIKTAAPILDAAGRDHARRSLQEKYFFMGMNSSAAMARAMTVLGSM